MDSFLPISPLQRHDISVLFEGCMIVERVKHIAHEGGVPIAKYFWRTFVAAYPAATFILVSPATAFLFVTGVGGNS